MRRSFALVLLAVPPLASACMGVGRDPVRFLGQTNLIVWDAEHGTEHFVRDARFETEGRDLGFIAPTPSRPDVQAANPEAFSLLARLAPRMDMRSYAGGMGGGGGPTGGGGVSVIERKFVAGYEATVLRASDARALTGWMNANGYPVPAYATRWTAPYVRRGWYFTAFKVAVAGGGGSTGPVRMSFRTDTPFNPYSVPAENGGSGGLSLYYVSAGGEVGKIGRSRPWVAPAWVVPLTSEAAKGLATDLMLTTDDLPQTGTVRFYRDPGFGRPGFDDVYFVPTPMPYPHWPSGLGLMSLGALAFGSVGRRRS